MKIALTRILAGLMGAALLWVVWLENAGPLDQCTAAGCVSTLTIETGISLREGTTYEMEVCLDDECWAGVHVANDSYDDEHGDVYIDWGGTVQVVFGEEERSRTGQVSIVVTADEEEILREGAEVEFEVFRPNGRWCEPTCYYGLMTV